jgi:hypothetical protein
MAMESFITQHGGTLGLTRYYGTAAPSLATDIGPYKVGDEVINTAPAAGGGSYRGWVCTTAGATGATSTWKGFGLLET